jgi:alpha-glucosidase
LPNWASTRSGSRLSERRSPGGRSGFGASAWRPFLAWRKTHPALIDGALEPAPAPPSLIAFRRRNAAESLLIVLNTAAEPASVPAELVALTRPLDGHGFPSSHGDGDIVLPRYGMFFGAE